MLERGIRSKPRGHARGSRPPKGDRKVVADGAGMVDMVGICAGRSARPTRGGWSATRIQIEAEVVAPDRDHPFDSVGVESKRLLKGSVSEVSRILHDGKSDPRSVVSAIMALASQRRRVSLSVGIGAEARFQMNVAIGDAVMHMSTITKQGRPSSVATVPDSPTRGSAQVRTRTGGPRCGISPN